MTDASFTPAPRVSDRLRSVALALEIPLGLFGFDLGVAVTDTKIKNTDAFNTAGAGDISDIAVPSLRFNMGLPFSIDVGAMVGSVPGTKSQSQRVAFS